MRSRIGIVVSLSVVVFFIVYTLILSVFTMLCVLVAGISVFFENVIYSTIHVLSFLFGIIASVIAHLIAGAVISRLSFSYFNKLSMTKNHVTVVLIIAAIYAIASLVTGTTIVPPLALLFPTGYLRIKMKNF